MYIPLYVVQHQSVKTLCTVYHTYVIKKKQEIWKKNIIVYFLFFSVSFQGFYFPAFFIFLLLSCLQTFFLPRRKNTECPIFLAGWAYELHIKRSGKETGTPPALTSYFLPANLSNRAAVQFWFVHLYSCSLCHSGGALTLTCYVAELGRPAADQYIWRSV